MKNIQLNRLSPNLIIKNFSILAIISVIGARIIFISVNSPLYFPIYNLTGFFHLFAIWDQGFSLWGGIITFFATFIIIADKENEDIKKWSDVFIFPFLILLMFSNIGDFLEGKNYGTETMLPWGITFNNIFIKYTVPIHPTQIYAFLYTLIIILGLKYYQKKSAFLKQNGNLATAAIAIYSFTRFLEEFLRGDETIRILFLNLAQTISLAAFTISMVFIIKEYKKFKNHLTS